MSDSRIPPGIEEFNGYIGTTADYNIEGTPVNNGNRLGLSDDNITDWSAHRANWRDNLYPKHSSPVTKTSVVVRDVQDFMRAFRAFAQPLLNIIAASPATTNDDAAVYNVVRDSEHANPTHPITPIAENVMADARQIGGGQVEFTCRTSHDSKRASKAEGADSVQVAYIIGTTPPANINATTSKEVFTHAKFTFHAGAENAGNKLYIYMRWYNTKHPELAGPWSSLVTVILA
jgi:hypothetical protein